MKKLLLIALLFANISFAQDTETPQISEEEYQRKIDSLNKSFVYQKGKIPLENGIAEIMVPEGYKFLDAKQSTFVLSDLWGNPPSEVIGLLFPEDQHPISDNFTYAVEVTYSEEGYIKDGDAKDIDYDELLEQMQDDTEASNDERATQGYPTMNLVGWASAPFYDEVNKKLHWAKELKFEGEEVNTLNYNIRVLGRKGFLNLNAIGTIKVLPLFKKDVNQILNSVSFTEGNTYADFNADYDDVAAYGIGGLIAGKLLAKVGFFAVLLKFWKVIAIGAVGLFSVFKNKILGRKEEEEEVSNDNESDETKKLS